jgi:hypothetical protein
VARAEHNLGVVALLKERSAISLLNIKQANKQLASIIVSMKERSCPARPRRDAVNNAKLNCAKPS